VALWHRSWSGGWLIRCAILCSTRQSAMEGNIWKKHSHRILRGPLQSKVWKTIYIIYITYWSTDVHGLAEFIGMQTQ